MPAANHGSLNPGTAIGLARASHPFSHSILPRPPSLGLSTVPGLRRLAILGNVGYSAALIEMVDVESSARKIGFDVERLEIRRAEDIEPALVGQQRGVGALYVCQDSLVVANQSRIIGWALAARLPAIYTAPDWVENGGLMAYGANERDLFARAADYVDKILKGTKPGDIPVEQPTKFQLVVNLKTAKALGLVISESFLALADEVIE
jgi:putative tryptophan/tyrosine transport system substrate-binding protein